MNKRVWLIVETTTKKIIDKAATNDAAIKVIMEIEKADKEVGRYEPQRYEVLCKYEDSNESNITLNEFQADAMTTGKGIEPQWSILQPAFGMLEEAGEVAGKISRVMREYRCKYTDTMRKEIALEIGDCMRYMAILSNNLGFKLSEIAEMNIEKIQNRVKNGTINGSGDHR